ncbi:ABC transporter substrate-binding protein [Methanococcus voltae]|uniref:ABC-type Fe3+-hydroxamate transport system periplasmic component-like protein n=1 Tax=Methanococcus voltae (strain ATCC BAA-1334 / A3) TaxID=456320 RepID=D7DT84_METV3|nr:ABC transporter substrate-binding protein [Methanococcus voltae]
MNLKAKIGLLMLFVLMIIPSAFATGNYDYRLGDINEDGKISVSDVVYLFNNRDLDIEDADVNADNKISVSDVVYLFNYYDEMSESITHSVNMDLKYYDAEGYEVNPYNGEEYEYKILTDSTGKKILLKHAEQSEPTGGNWDSKYETCVDIPVTKVLVMSSTQIALMNPLNDDGSVFDSVKGITYGGGYAWYYPDIETGLDDGTIVDLGSSSAPVEDRITALSDSDLSFVYPDSWSGDAFANTCDRAGVLPVSDAEYLEQTFLGRCEWAKMFAAFYDKEEIASKYFNEQEKKSLNVKRITQTADSVPTVAWGSRTAYGTYVPNAQSYVVKGLVQDCNVQYTFLDQTGTGSSSVDYETFFDRNKNADVWIVSSSAGYLTEFKTLNTGLSEYKAYQNDKIFCFSDSFYQTGLEKTDKVLEDLAIVSHPDLYEGKTTEFILHFDPETSSASPYTA